MQLEILSKSSCPPVLEYHFLKVSRLDVAKQKKLYGATHTWSRARFSKMMKFSEKVTLTGAEASKIMKFARWRDFNALRRAHVHFT